MAKRIQISKVAGWVYIEDDGKVVEVDSPAAAPEGATCFELAAIPVDSQLFMLMADGSRERSSAMADSVRGCLVGWHGLCDKDGIDIPYHKDRLSILTVEVVLPIANHLFEKAIAAMKEQQARRGNARSGTSPEKKRSGGTPTAGSRTASRATS